MSEPNSQGREEPEGQHPHEASEFELIEADAAAALDFRQWRGLQGQARQGPQLLSECEWSLFGNIFTKTRNCLTRVLQGILTICGMPALD